MFLNEKKVVDKHFHNISFRCVENCAVETNFYQGNTASSVKQALLGRIEGCKNH